MSDPVSREELTARLEAIEARSDARIAGLIGEVRTSLAELKGDLKVESRALAEEVRGDYRALKAASVTKLDMVIQTVAVLGILIAIFFGVVASNQGAATLGYTSKDVADRAAVAAADRAVERTISALKAQAALPVSATQEPTQTPQKQAGK